MISSCYLYQVQRWHVLVPVTTYPLFSSPSWMVLGVQIYLGSRENVLVSRNCLLRKHEDLHLFPRLQVNKLDMMMHAPNTSIGHAETGELLCPLNSQSDLIGELQVNNRLYLKTPGGWKPRNDSQSSSLIATLYVHAYVYSCVYSWTHTRMYSYTWEPNWRY